MQNLAKDSLIVKKYRIYRAIRIVHTITVVAIKSSPNTNMLQIIRLLIMYILIDGLGFHS